MPDNLCLFLEPGLRRYSDDDRLARMNQGTLRASSWNLGSDVVDVDGEANSYDPADYVSYAEWLERQKIISASFSLRVVTGKNNQLTAAEKLIQNFKETNDEFKESLQIRQIRLRDKWQQLQKRKNRVEADAEAAQKVLQAEVEAARLAQNEALNGSQAAVASDQALSDKRKILTTLFTEWKDIENEVIIVTQELTLSQQKLTTLQQNQTPSATELAEIAELSGTGPKSVAALDAKYKDLATRAAAKKQEYDTKKADYETEVNIFEDRFKAALAKRVKDLEKEIEDAKAALASKVRDVEKEQRESVDKLREKMNLLLKLTKQKDGGLNFRERIESGNITIDRYNVAEQKKTNSLDEFTAPGDLRYGGGSFWKYSSGIKTLPYAAYLLYDKKGRGYNGSGDRYTRVWSGLGTDKKVGAGLDKFVVYSLNNMNEIPASVDNLVSVYDERTIVNNYEAGGLLTHDKNHQPFRLYKAPTTDEDWANRDLCYMATGNEIGSTLQGEKYYDTFFYDLPLKPGTFVHFYIKSSDGSDDGKQERMKIASRLQEYNVDGTADINLFSTGVGLSGHIENIHLANLNTSISEQKLEALSNAVNNAKVTLETAQQLRPLVISNVKNAQDALNVAENELKNAQEKSGKFDYDEGVKSLKASSNVEDLFQSILVADIRVTENFVVKNVLYANLVEISPYGSSGISDVICKTGNGNEGGTTSKKSTTTDRRIYVKLANSGNHKLVPIETVKPIFKAGTQVVYENILTNKLETGEVITPPVNRLTGIQASYVYLIRPSSGATPVQILHSRVALLLPGADTLTSIDEDPTLTLSKGYNELNYIPLYNLFSPTDDNPDLNMIVRHMSTYLQKYYDAPGKQYFSKNAKAIYGGGTIATGQVLRTDVISKMAIILPPENFNLIKAPVSQMQNKAAVQALSNAMRDSSGNIVEDIFSTGTRCIMVDLYSVYDGVDPTNGATTMNAVDIDGNVRHPDDHFISVGFDDGNGYEIQNLYLKDFTSMVKFRLPQLILKPGQFNNNEKGYSKLKNATGGNVFDIAGITGGVLANGLKPTLGSENANVEHLLSSKLSQPAFVLTSGTDGDSEALVDDEDEKGWESSWKRTEDEVAKWASSTSDSDSLLVVSDKETNAVPAWVSSSSSDVESLKEPIEAAWASSSSLSKQSGGFASSTSDDDADNLAAIISKIDRVPNQASAAWAEDSELDE